MATPSPIFNHRVLMSDADNFSIEAPINPYYGAELLDQAAAVREHTELIAMYERAGIIVERVASPTDSQDGIYTANWALTRNGKAVMSRLPNARKAEEAHARNALEALGYETILVPNDWRFSGQGDSLACGDYLLSGHGYRSDREAIEFAAEQLGYTPIIVQTIPARDASGEPIINAYSGWPDSFFYDVDLAVAIIEPPHDDFPGLIAYCRDALTPESHAVIDATPMQKIIIDFDEATKGFAANLISTGQTVIMSAHAPKLRAELEARGYHILTPEVHEIIKGGGFIRCTSLTLN